MLPNMYKIAGELTPTVIHVAARTVATHALSIFGDHSDVMAARQTGFAMLASSSVQEAQDMALVAHIATLESRVPFLHFFDGFRTSHEVAKIELIDDDDVAAADRRGPDRRSSRSGRSIPIARSCEELLRTPTFSFKPGRRSTPSTTRSRRHASAGHGRESATETGRRYDHFEYMGSPDAETVMVIMGSGSGAAHEAVDRLLDEGRKVGVVQVRLYRPFAVVGFRRCDPGVGQERWWCSTAPRSPGQWASRSTRMSWLPSPSRVDHWTYTADGTGCPPRSSPRTWSAGAFNEVERESPRRHFTVGIVDDVTLLSIDFDPLMVV